MGYLLIIREEILMIDFHSHIMFAVDDGSKSIEMTKEMLLNSISQGVTYIVSTPHFITGQSEVTKEIYNEKLSEMKAINGIENVTILKGMEVYIDPNLPTLYDEGRVWGINEGKYMLIELPMREFPKYTEDVFYELRIKGITPILAHPERNLSIMKNPKLLEDLISQGNLAQVNAGSLTGLYGKEIKAFAELLVKRNMVHVIGSDGHNNSRRNTNISDGYEKIKELNTELYNWIELNSEKIISSEDVEPLKVKEEKKSFLKRLFSK